MNIFQLAPSSVIGTSVSVLQCLVHIFPFDNQLVLSEYPPTREIKLNTFNYYN